MFLLFSFNIIPILFFLSLSLSCSSLFVLLSLLFSLCSSLFVLLSLFLFLCSSLFILLSLFFSRCCSLLVLLSLFFSLCSSLFLLLSLSSPLHLSCSLGSFFLLSLILFSLASLVFLFSLSLPLKPFHVDPALGEGERQLSPLALQHQQQQQEQQQEHEPSAIMVDDDHAAGEAKRLKVFDSNVFKRELLADIRVVVQEATLPLQTEMHKVQSTLEDQQQRMGLMDHRIDELDAGLDRCILQHSSNTTPPVTPWAQAVPADEPPGLQTGYASKASSSALTKKTAEDCGHMRLYLELS